MAERPNSCHAQKGLYKFPLLVWLLALLTVSCVAGIPKVYDVNEGDVVFQSLPHSDLVDAIEGMTHSEFSHCAIVEKKDGKWFVIEAIGPVREWELEKWIKQGRGSRFSAYRLKELHRARIPAILEAARAYLGKPYDIHYEFDDDRIYCSELIFKAVRQAEGIDLGQTQVIGSLDWVPYQKFIVSIEGHVPLMRELITPVALSRAAELEEVYSNFRK